MSEFEKSESKNSLLKILATFGKKLLAWNADFNLLNSVFRTFAALFRLAHLNRLADFFETAVQEKNGVNRFVLVRYLLKELFLYFFIAFLFFFMIFFVNQILLVAEKILKQRAPVKDVVLLITYSLPNVIAQSAPNATLVGFLMCLGRLASENEILILRASGQGYRLILFPVLILGLLISIASFFVNDYLLPQGTLKYKKLYREMLAANPAVELEPNSVKRTSDKTLVIGEVNEDKVSDLVFFDTDSDGNQRIIVADSSVVKKSDAPGILMRLVMSDSTVMFFDQNVKGTYDVLSSETVELNIFESSIMGQSHKLAPREMTSLDLHNRIKEMEKSGDYSKKQMNQYKLEYSKKFSVPFGAIFFAMLALPLALLFGKHNGQTIGLIIGLVIAVLYWAVSIVGQIFSSRSGLHGVITMWLPDIIIGVSGIIFYIKLVTR